MKPLPAFLLLFSSLLAVLMPKKTARACGFYVAPGEYRFWLLQPDLTNQPELTPFYFATTYFYKQDLNAGQNSWKQQNAEEWGREIRQQATQKDIHRLLDETPPRVFFDQQKQLVQKNSFLRVLMKKQHHELYRYLVLSKKIEQETSRPDPWDENARPDLDNIQLIEEARMLLAGAKSRFVQLRTAYQLIRLYSYSGQSAEINKVYASSIEPVAANSWIKSAALYQKAIHAPHPESDYLLSKAFDQGIYNRAHCIARFRFKQFDETWKLTKNDHERHVLMAMKVLHSTGRCLQDLKRIYAAEPAYRDLPFLLLREINKIEDWLVTTKVTNFGSPAVYENYYNIGFSDASYKASNYKADVAYAKAIYQFLLQVMRDRKGLQQGLLQLYAAHLSMLLGDNRQATVHLAQARRIKELPRNLQTQLQINKYLLHLEAGFGKAVENEFMAIINTPDRQLGIYDPNIMKNQLVLYTARKLMKQNNKAIGLMLLGRTNRALGEISDNGYKGMFQEIEEHAVEKDYDRMLEVLAKKDKTPLEQFITNGKFRSPIEHYYDQGENIPLPRWDRHKVLDCKASWYIREHRLPEALATLRQIPDGFYAQQPYKNYMGGNAFFVNINRPHYNAKEDSARWLNKRQMVEHMLYLEQLATQNKHKADLCYYQLGNAWYNLSWYGKNWLMVKQWWSIYEEGGSDLYDETDVRNEDYYGCKQAWTYYKKAISVSPDKKLTALCLFMADQCEKNYRQYEWSRIDRSRIRRDYVYRDPPPSYKLAKEKGVLTDFTALVQECELYQSFIKQYNKHL